MKRNFTVDGREIDADSLFRRLYEVRTLIPGGHGVPRRRRVTPGLETVVVSVRRIGSFARLRIEEHWMQDTGRLSRHGRRLTTRSVRDSSGTGRAMRRADKGRSHA